MPYEVIICPACQTRLQLPDDLDAPQVVCPRCQKEIANPRLTPATLPVSGAPAPTEDVEPIVRAPQQQAAGCSPVMAVFVLALVLAGMLGWAVNARSLRGMNEPVMLIGVAVVLALLGLMAGLLVPVLNRPNTDYRFRPHSGIETGCMVIFILAGSAVALFVVFFVTCAVTWR